MPGLQRVLFKLYSRDSMYSESGSCSQYSMLRVLVCYSFTGYIDRVANMSRTLNTQEFLTYQSSEYARIKQSFEYVGMSLNNS